MVVVVAVVIIVVVNDAASTRSFFLRRNRDISSCSAGIPLDGGGGGGSGCGCAVVLFFDVVCVDSACAGGKDFVDSLSSVVVFLLSILLGDVAEFRLLAIIDGFSNIFGTICGELPNLELFSARGLLSELNRHEDSELPNKLLRPVDFADNESAALMPSVLIWNVDENDVFISPFLMLGGNKA